MKARVIMHRIEKQIDWLEKIMSEQNSQTRKDAMAAAISALELTLMNEDLEQEEPPAL